jgi:hypothetical protein
VGFFDHPRERQTFRFTSSVTTKDTYTLQQKGALTSAYVDPCLEQKLWERLAIACKLAQSGTAKLHSCSHQSCIG